MTVTTIRHILFDADGVLQEVPGGWFEAMTPYLGERTEEFFHATWKEELPALAGEIDYLPLLASKLAEFGVSTPVEHVFADVWHRIVVHEESIALVHALRESGYGVHLGTNQEQYRAAHMRASLGYDELFDVSCYSFELGIAKPDPGFFARAAERIGTRPAKVLFIDDLAANVASAREAGMRAEQWTFGDGHAVLRERLAAHGVEVMPGR